MEEKEVKKKHPKFWVWTLIILAAVALIAGAIWFVLFRVNEFTLHVELAGESRGTAEYGEAYEDPGYKAVLRGTLILQDGRVLEDAQWKVIGQVDENTLGLYSITYAADYRWFHGEAQRTVAVVDTQCPQIILTEDGTLTPGERYVEAGFKAVDNHDGDITSRVIRSEEPGLVTYAVVDSSGNPAYATREIPIYDILPPEIILEGGDQVAITVGTFYEEPGFQALDDFDGDLTEQVEREGEVVWYEKGTYPITYTVCDACGNETTVTRTVEVKAQPRPETVYPQRKTVYLTFDDGPGPYTEGLLDLLDAYGAKATFFVTDSGYNRAMREIVRRGHGIGIHTVSHDYGTIYASPQAYFDDLYRMQDIIYENTGVRTTLMRFPGGSSNTVSRHNCEGLMTILTQAVQDAGFQYFDWNVDSNDAGGAKKAKTVLSNVVEGVSANRVSVVLQHDIHAYSVEAIEDILVWGLNNGYVFEALTPNSPGFHHGVNN